MSFREIVTVGLLALGLMACGSCGGASSPPPSPSAQAGAVDCDQPMAKVKRLLTEASAERIALASNENRERVSAAEVAMVEDDLGLISRECQRTPGRVAPCLASATSAHHVLEVCLAPLSDDGREGESVIPAP